MTTFERVLLGTFGTLYSTGILLAVLTTGRVLTYLPHAAVLLVCAAAIHAMLHDRRNP
jgi:hypothetical protein